MADDKDEENEQARTANDFLQNIRLRCPALRGGHILALQTRRCGEMLK